MKRTTGVGDYGPWKLERRLFVKIDFMRENLIIWFYGFGVMYVLNNGRGEE